MATGVELLQSFGQTAINDLTGTSSSEDLEKVEREVKNSTQTLSAQQIANKYDITIAEAKQILNNIQNREESKNTTVKIEPEVPRKVTPKDGSTMEYEA